MGRIRRGVNAFNRIFIALDVTIHFIDGGTAEELYLVRASLYSKAKTDYSGWAFEGRVNNCVYNLVVFVNEKLK